MRKCFPLAALILAGWFGGGVALGQPPTVARSVQDDLGLFSAEAKAKANGEIARILQTHKKDLFIETTHPPKQPKSLDFNDTAAVDKFIDGWARKKFENEKVNGVQILFIEQAKLKKLRVLVGAETLKRGLFTNTNRDELVRKIAEHMKTGDKDGALLAATGYVADAMQRNSRSSISAVPQANAPAPEQGVQHPAPAVQPTPIITWILIGLGILLAFWIISAVIRGFSAMGGGGGYGPGYGGYGGGGGGFMTGFLGGMFGAAAGMWAYNHFFGGGGPSAYAGGSPSAGYATTERSDVGAGDPAVGGSDSGEVDKGAIEAPDDGGGGDWGGGDAGGGDWGGGGDPGGGGDWGGGGGDFGGGGGGGDW